MYYIAGDTYRYKEELQSMGARYDPRRKVWETCDWETANAAIELGLVVEDTGLWELARERAEIISGLLIEIDNLKGRLKAANQTALKALERPNLPRSNITKLIQLCHPDKHGGSKLATEMTQELLLMRDRYDDRS